MTTAIQVHTGEPPAGKALELARPRTQLLRPIAAPADVVTAQNEARDLVAKALVEGRDYGKIPGTGDKPTLLKPGAERLTLAFGLAAQFRILEHERDHDRVNVYVKNGKELESRGLYRVVMECSLVNRETGEVVGSAIASCSTLESKYISRPRDSENTVIKMATKRSHVGATLNALGLSEQFTQDVEDTAAAPAAGEPPGRSSEPGVVPVDTPPALDPSCPVCGGKMYDNRTTKRNPKAPDFKCRDRSCDGVLWPGKPAGEAQAAAPAASGSGATSSVADSPESGSLEWARALPLMGRPTSWAHEGIAYGGKAIGTVPTPALKQAAHFFKGKLEEAPDDERAPRMRDQVKAIALVVDDRAKLDPKQEELPIEKTPAARRIADAEASAPVAAAVQEDDDLPF